MSVSTNVSKVFLGQVTHQAIRQGDARFTVEVIDGDSGLENYTECLVNVNMSIFISTQSIERTRLQTGDLISIRPEDVEIIPSETNPKNSFVLIKDIRLLQRAVDESLERVSQTVDKVYLNEQAKRTATSKQSIQTNFLTDSYFEEEFNETNLESPPKKVAVNSSKHTQENFLSDDDDFPEDFENMCKIVVSPQSVHMNTAQGALVVDKMKEI